MKRSLAFTAFIFLSSVFPALAQVNLAVLRGSVNDGKLPLAHARVLITSTDNGAARNTETNAAGQYEFAALQPGPYTLEIAAPGFASAKQSLILEVGQQATVDVPLHVGPASDSIEVNSSPEILKTSDASVGEVIEKESVKELPLNGRMLVDLMLTVPGTHVSHGAQTGDMNPLYWRPGQRSAVTVGGNRPNANYFLLDGATNTDPTFNTLNLSPSPDAVQEFQVQVSNYTAEMGGAGGGQVNIVTRSGTNAFHGTAYDFLRNDKLDAHSFNDMGMSHLVQNNFGASLGGPLYGKKTFFFVNYEGLRHTEAMTMIDTVPTPAEIAGDFSMSGVNIYDPKTSQPNPNFDPTKPVSVKNPQIIRQQFPGNVIPASRINPVAAAFLSKYVPAPNLGMGMMGGMTMMGQPTVVGFGNDVNNYLDVRNMHHVNDQGTIRVDHNFSRGDILTGRYSLSSENGFTPQNLPGFGAFDDNFAQNGNISWSHPISNNMLDTTMFTVSRLAMHRFSENNLNNDIVSQLGIQGVGFGGAGAYGAPWFNVQGYSGMGDTFAATPMKAWDTQYELRNVFSWQRGSHALKFGGSYRRYVWPMWGFFQNRGYYQFTNGFTTDIALNDGTGSSLASFLLGLPAVRQRQAGIPSMDLRQWSTDAFAEDSWRISDRTTINFGLRYEYMNPLYDIKNTNSNLVFQNGTPMIFIGGENGYPKGLMYANKLDFAPRLGIAHQLPRFGIVLHAAYGIFYTPVDLNTWCNQRHNLPNVFPETNQSDNFVPTITSFNFNPAVLGKTVTSFAAFDPHAPAQYVQQWSTSIEKSLGRETTLELGYLGARGFHLQRAVLINNPQPGPGLLQPRRPFKTVKFAPGSTLPDGTDVSGLALPISTINQLQNSAQSWYDAGYVNLRRRYSHGLSLLANYTYAKSLSNAPDFRSPMFESTVPQNSYNLASEKGPACDIRHRFAMSAVFDIPALRYNSWLHAVSKDWKLSSVYQVQTGFPFTISVFGDTANAGTVLGENPIRANATGQPIFGAGTRTAAMWFNPAAFTTPAAYTFGNVGRNSVYGPGMQTLDLAIVRQFALTEKSNLQIRGEFFNALNHTNLGTPDRFVNTPQFGSITEAATPGREVQVSARISF